eukprot:1772371-Amphidinium_carterae.1
MKILETRRVEGKEVVSHFSHKFSGESTNSVNLENKGGNGEVGGLRGVTPSVADTSARHEPDLTPEVRMSPPLLRLGEDLIPDLQDEEHISMKTLEDV